jgi:hypothetical protein
MKRTLSATRRGPSACYLRFNLGSPANAPYGLSTRPREGAELSILNVISFNYRNKA